MLEFCQNMVNHEVNRYSIFTKPQHKTLLRLFILLVWLMTIDNQHNSQENNGNILIYHYWWNGNKWEQDLNRNRLQLQHRCWNLTLRNVVSLRSRMLKLGQTYCYYSLKVQQGEDLRCYNRFRNFRIGSTGSFSGDANDSCRRCAIYGINKRPYRKPKVLIQQYNGEHSQKRIDEISVYSSCWPAFLWYILLKIPLWVLDRH